MSVCLSLSVDMVYAFMSVLHLTAKEHKLAVAQFIDCLVTKQRGLIRGQIIFSNSPELGSYYPV